MAVVLTKGNQHMNFCCCLFLVGCLRGLLFGGRYSCIEDSFAVDLSLCLVTSLR